jgi:GTP-binding protein
MKVREAVFVKSAVAPGGYPSQGLPEVAFAGRSNVGKSSLINCLVHRRGLAKTSSTPGKTRLLNFFVVNSALSLVDLPGYGFARVPEKVRRSWGSIVETYLKTRKELRLVILLLDARHEPTDQDLQLVGWLRQHHIPSLAVVTKVDKVSRSRRKSQIAKILSRLGEYEGRMIPFSAATREGKAAVWDEIMRAGQVSSDSKTKSSSPERTEKLEKEALNANQNLFGNNS